jgi:glutathione peroxidase
MYGCFVTCLPLCTQLNELYSKYSARGLAVLAFPCDQFHQEPWPDAEIKAFVQKEFSVGFDMFAKVDVNGAEAHPVFQALAQAMPQALVDGKIKGNFNKFLVDARGVAVKHYPKKTAPAEAEADLLALLREAPLLRKQ